MEWFRFNWYSVPPLVASLLLLGIGLFVYMTDKKSKTHRALCMLTTSTFVWLCGYAMMYSIRDSGAALLCCKILYSAVIFIPVFFLNFTVNYFKIETSYIWIRLSYLAGLAFVYMLWSGDLLVAGVAPHFWGLHTKVGKLHFLYQIFFILSFGRCLYLLMVGYRKAKKISQLEANRTKYLFWAFFVSTIAAVDFLVDYGFDIYPIGFLFMSGWVIITAYAILKHQLLDIEVIIRKTLVFAGLFAATYAVVAGFMMIGQVLLENFVGWSRWFSLVPSVAVIVLILRPLEAFLVRVTDRFLFQKKYDYKELLKAFSTEVLTVLDIGKLTHMTVEKISGIMKIETCAVLLREKEKGNYILKASTGLDRNIMDTVLDSQNTLVTFMQRTKAYLSTQDLTKDMTIPENVKQNMQRLKFQLSIPLILYDDLIGILTLGKKKSDENYTQDDMDILHTLARTLAIAISNAQMLDELGKTQAEAAQREKMAVIGTLSAGINHEICNPLGIARGQCEMFLLNVRDGFYKNKTDKELIEKAMAIMHKVIHETDRATVITKRLSSFAKPSKGIFDEEIKLKDSVNEVLALIGYEMKLDKIEVENNVHPDCPTIRGDKKQIEEVFFNIIRNAAQAIKEKGKITVSSRSDGENVMIDIADTGQGISDENMKQIFNPFFTTKDPGKGTGLGLFIVRQVVERNKGRISVTSKVGAGTTFTLEFPVAEKVKV